MLRPYLHHACNVLLAHTRSGPLNRLVFFICLTLTPAYRCLPAPAAPRPHTVVFIAGKKSHGPGEHEYEKGLRLLKQSLDSSPNVKGFRTELYLNGWPDDPRAFDRADTVVLYCDGSDHGESDH